MKIYNKSLSRWKIYILVKKEKANLDIPTVRNQKTRNWLVKKKNTVWPAKLQCKEWSILSRAK